jgi:L-arabinose isomerase
MASRMRLNRKVIVGHWQDPEVVDELSAWIRAACAWQDSQNLKIARFGDNMRNVAVTEGDKVEAQMRFGYSVNGYSLEDLMEYIKAVQTPEIEELMVEYEDKYNMDDSLIERGENRDSLIESAKVELGLRAFLENGGFKGFTTTFQNLSGLKQLPGLAVQRLMADGYGFGAEGDWKTAMLLRAMKVMDSGLEGGTSFMEHYTYDLTPEDKKVLGAHMLEVCDSVAAQKPSLEIHPLDIGGKADPVRAVFDAASGPALNVSLVDMGTRFRLIANKVDVIKPGASLPNLPVARAVWKPKPDFETAIEAWIQAGGAHHTVFSQSLTTEHVKDFANMGDVEFLLIDEETNMRDFNNELKWNETHYHLKNS